MAPRTTPVDAALHLLREDSRVQDVHVGELSGTATAWVVPRRAVQASALESLLREHLGDAAPAVALVDALPLQDTGTPDEARLARWTSATPAMLQQMESRWRSSGREVAVLAGPRVREERYTPLDELLPGPLMPRPGEASGASSQTSSADAVDLEQAPPSLLDGGPPCRPEGEPRLLGEMLRRAVTLHPEKTLTFIDVEGRREVLRFDALWREALRLCGGLQARGLKAGDRAVLVLERPGEVIRAFWACTLAGVVPSLLAWPASFERSHPTMARVLSVAKRLGGPWVLAGPAAVGTLEAEGLRVATLAALDTGGEGQPAAVPEGAPALMSFTSGSTGLPKGVVLTHDNLLDMCDAMMAGGWYMPQDVGVSWMPLDHVAGITYSHLLCLRARTSHALVSRDHVLADVLRWMDLLSELKGTHGWAPNFAFGLVADRLERSERRAWTLSHVRVLSCAGEPLVARTLQRFTDALAGEGLRWDVVCPGWGMAETTSFFTNTRGVRTHDGEAAVELGPPPAGSALRIVDDADQVVPQGRVGHLQVRGASVLAGYLDDPELNARSFTTDGWFRTGDLAWVRNGQMAITGREKEVLILHGNNVYPQEIETVVEEVPGVLPTYSVACATRVGGAQTDEIVVFFVPAPDAPPLGGLLRAIREAVGRRLGFQVAWLVPLARQQVPRTELGKRGRTELRRRFEAGELAEERRVAERLLGGRFTLPPCLAVPRWRQRQPGAGGADAGAVLVVGDASWAEALRARMAPREVLHAEPEDGSALSRHLPSAERRVREVVYVAAPSTGAPSRDTLVRAVAPLLGLVQSLAPLVEAAPCRLRVVVPQVGASLETGAGAHLLPGLLRAAEAEVPGLETSLLWVPQERPAAVDSVATELAQPRPAFELAWREGRRWERGFVAWTPPQVPEPVRLKKAGFYVVTGALGGLGQAWARHLRNGLGARLLLVGRRQRDAAVASLERELGAAEYVTADVTEPEALRRVLADAEARHGQRLDGAFHFAGTLNSVPLMREAPAPFVEGAAAHVLGAVALADAFRERPEALLVFASSLMGTLGAGLHAGYCAATGFLDRYAEALVTDGRRAVSVAFSSVRDTGMARGLTASPPGYRMLELPQALAALALAVESGEARVLAGVEGSALPWRTVGLGEGESLDVAHVFLEAGGSGAAGVDGAGAQVHVLESLPRQASGAVDREALGAMLSGGGARIPEGPLEVVVAEAFRDVLGVDDVGAHADFFVLGGSSLQATRVLARVQERTGLRLPVTALFEHASVARLAAHVRHLVDPEQLDVSLLTDAQVALLLSVMQAS
ncbi:SDR family NAD(P)-dependent oxidoreductase [Myxococcus xanthus]|uniref:SDR family NAD(P)-dependent oxidoreductase n=1 Tax=Myxococcus xanthus TaxID=34 RepID=UPI0011622041|nr:SDR family NAD(P)-dependent oxidoreductase [Myxococcus xanthus]QDE81485.1 peptide synthetase [Myxococcus xanthus]